MDEYLHYELPFKSKLQMLDDIVKIIYYLHEGRRHDADQLITDLKARSIYLEEPIQQAVLMFAEQVCFQFDYDPYHKVTEDVQKSADKLIENMGFSSPSEGEH